MLTFFIASNSLWEKKLVWCFTSSPDERSVEAWVLEGSGTVALSMGQCVL